MRAISCVKSPILVALLAGSPASAQAPDPGAPSPPKPLPARLGSAYTHPLEGFSIRRPRDWNEGTPAEGAVSSLYGPKDRFYVPRMDVFAHAVKGDAADLSDTYRNSYRKAYPGVRFEAERVFPLADGGTAIRFVAVIPQDAAPARSLVTVAAKDGRGYALMFTTFEGAFIRYRALIERSMETLRLFPAPALAPETKKRFLEKYREAFDAYGREDIDRALAAFVAAAEILPAYADLHRAIGSLRARKGDAAGAAAAFRKALELDPDQPDVLYNLGTMELRAGRYDDAEKLLVRAAELDPENDKALSNLGSLSLARGRYEEARTRLDKALEMNPESPVAHFGLGQALEGLNRPDEALRHYRDALVLQPEHAGAREAKERLEKKRGDGETEKR